MNRSEHEKRAVLGELAFREAQEDDLPTIIQMLFEDEVARKREDFRFPLPASYLRAFQNICESNRDFLWVLTLNEEVAGVFQLSILPNLTYQGSSRALVEGVRIHQKFRGQGLGLKMIEKAIALAKEKQCVMIQLTTDKQRPEAVVFYEKMGFKPSHEGMKLFL